jgi:hypothetical protein
MNRRGRIKGFVCILVSLVLCEGCAATQRKEAVSIERLLSEAGFKMIPATTPEQLASLKAMPPLKLKKQTQNGKVVYTYADPENCKCVYIGGPDQYAEYRHFLDQKSVVKEDQLDNIMETEEQAENIEDTWVPLWW